MRHAAYFVAVCQLFAEACRLLSSCGGRFSLLQLWRTGSRACGLCSCGTQALQLRLKSSVVVARRVSCPTACGILVP